MKDIFEELINSVKVMFFLVVVFTLPALMLVPIFLKEQGLPKDEKKFSAGGWIAIFSVLIGWTLSLSMFSFYIYQLHSSFFKH